jgi:hypothetical protein
MPLPLCKFCSAQGASNILRLNSIFITSPLDLNDPFEMRPCWTNEHELAAYTARKRQYDMVEGFPIVIAKKNGLVPSGATFDLEPEPPVPVEDQIGISDDYNEVVYPHLHRRFRVLSLVPGVVDLKSVLKDTRPRQILMWSHYADQFQGVCLALDPRYFNNGMKKGGFRVHYSTVRKMLPTSFYQKYTMLSGRPDDPSKMDGELESALIDILTSKSKVWNYEREVRMIYDLSKLNPAEDFGEFSEPCPPCKEKKVPKEKCKIPTFRNVLNLPEKAIRAVVFGADIPSNYVDALLPILSEKRYGHLKFYWSSYDAKEYVIRYSETDLESIATYQRTHSERINRAKNHNFFEDGKFSCAPFGAQKGINYRPPR